MDFKQSKRSGWLIILEFLGTYNRCWRFDLHTFYDESEKEINHLNIHHTATTAVIPNSSSSGTCEKRKICSIRFHSFRQVEAANEFADFLSWTGAYAKKIDQRFFSTTSKFRNIVTSFTKLTKRVTGSPRGFQLF